MSVADIGTAGTIATAIGVVIVAVLRFRDAQERRAAIAAAKMAAQEAKAAVESSNAALAEIDGKIYKLTEQVNGKLAQLLALTREAAFAKGLLEGKAEAGQAADDSRREADASTPPKRAAS